MTQLDVTAADIVTHQKDAVLERKEVAQRTKDFRKLDDTEKLSEYKTLLKSYQTFIDLITTHGKESSSAFLQLYTTISDAPDPFPLLEASVEALVTAEDVVPRLTKENTDLRKRVDKLTQDLESTESQLQSERQGRKEAEEGSGKKTDEVEDSWRKVLEEKENNWSTKEKTFEEKIESQDRLFKELRANYEVSQRLGQHEQDNAAQKAASAELQLITSDLEKTSNRLAEVQARNEQLRIELAQMSSQSSKSSNDDAQVLRLQSENSSLLRKMDNLRFEREAERSSQADQIKQLGRQKESAQQESHDLRTRIQKYSDYDEVKRELDMLRSIELSANDDGEDTEITENGTTEKNSLEQLLLTRNKKLSNDLTLMRVSHKEITEQLDELKTELDKTKIDLDESQKLSSKLENDLTQLQEEAASGLPSSGMSVAGTYVSRYPQSTRRGRSSPTSSIISGFDGNSRGDSFRSEGGGSGILPMVQAQRDRFKQKTTQLEEELQKTYGIVSSLRQEVASLQKDNLSLYEKSRYVSAYSRTGTTSSAYDDHRHAGTTNDDGGRWKAQYEANISPFAAFQGREASRAYKRMSVPERMVFSLTRIVLATRTSRNLFAGYCLALHVLVFFMLYWMSAATSHISYTAPSAAMAAAPGLKDSTPQQPNWREDGFE